MNDPPITALVELRENLREAARRDIVQRVPRRRRRRALLVSAAVLLGSTAVAGAANLISSGQPVPGVYKQPARYQSANGLQVAIKAHDKPLAWGVAVYTSRAGEQCAIVGRVNGATLGQLTGGQFHAYRPGHPGPCGSVSTPRGLFYDVISLDGRTVVYGRARPGVRRVVASIDGKRYPAPTGLGGAFVLVFSGRVTLPSVEVA